MFLVYLDYLILKVLILHHNLPKLLSLTLPLDLDFVCLLNLGFLQLLLQDNHELLLGKLVFFLLQSCFAVVVLQHLQLIVEGIVERLESVFGDGGLFLLEFDELVLLVNHLLLLQTDNEILTELLHIYILDMYFSFFSLSSMNPISCYCSAYSLMRLFCF